MNNHLDDLYEQITQAKHEIVYALDSLLRTPDLIMCEMCLKDAIEEANTALEMVRKILRAHG